MSDLSTQCMGLNLRNPLIVASCSLTGTLEGVRKCSDAGAGAVVLKSVFEEQFQIETSVLEEQSWMSGHAEALDYVRGMGMALGPKEYLKLIEEAKGAVDIPVIASLNCVTAKWWVEYAKQVELAGADGLELNVSIMPNDLNRPADEIEEIFYSIVEGVKSHIDLPVALKIGPYFTSMAHFAKALSERGVSALVLFNRFYQFDIDVDEIELAPGYQFSSPAEIGQSLRWISLLADRVKCGLIAATGVHDGTGAVKQLLAGASAVQVCSTLYMQGVLQIQRICGEVEKWMDKHEFGTVADFKGRLCQERSSHPEMYERLQYIKALVGME